MRSAPSKAFRRQCLVLVLLAISWSFPSAAHADFYPLQTVKSIADTLKPNVLIVLETAESMQGLPGENAARYNEVGSDCEDGSRQCRLVGQSGRWNFSGMGQNGMYFGVAPASCTHTETYTYPDTRTKTAATTVTQTTTQTATGQQTSTGSSSSTATATGTGTATGSSTAAGSGTGNVLGTVTASWTVTATATPSATGVTTGYVTVSVTSTAVGTATTTMSATSSSGGVVTLTKTAIATGTVTQTGNVTASQSATATRTASGSVTATGTVSRTAAVTATGTVTVSATVTVTGTPTTTRTVTVNATGTVTGSATVQATGTETASTTVSATKTATASLAATGTRTLTGTISATGTVTGTATVTATGAQNGSATVTATKTSTTSATANATGAGTGTAYGAYFTVTGYATSTNTWYIYYIGSTKTYARTITGTGTGTETVGASGDQAGTGSVSLIGVVGTATAAFGTATYTLTRTVNATCAGSGTAPSTGTALVAASQTTGTGTHTASGTCWGGVNSDASVTTGTGTASATLTGTTVVTGTGTACVTATVSTTGSGTATASSTVSGVSTATASGVATGNATASATATVTLTGTVTSTPTATASATFSATEPGTEYATAVDTETYSATSTHTVSTCGFTGSTDPNRCDASPSTGTTSGFCNETGAGCASDGSCTSILGDFCQVISSANDGSGRLHNESCITVSGTPWGSCKHGVVTANTTCASSGDTSCNTALPGDFCAEGQPAKMCADTGLWCASNADCPGAAATDLCVPASSRMMITKRALRRAITEHSDKVNFGFMNTYQGKGIGSTNPTTEIFPYVKLQACSGLTTITETKFLARGELEAANPSCFSLTAGPSSTCTVDYGGNGAVNATAGLNQVTYTRLGTNDSRWGIPRGDGSGKSTHLDESWASCPSSAVSLPACHFSGQGTGLYEGSYYTFTYSQGTPIANGGVDGEGSRAHPVYFTTYKGKYYSDGGGNCYNAVDAERTDIVNDGIFNRVAYTGNPYNAANEVAVPWSGSANAAACDATTGAIWNSNVVPFLNTATQTSTDTFTFGSSTITRDQKTLMTTARLDKASFGGVAATGRLAPIGCALTDAQSYMTTVASNDLANNGGNAPCWSSDIVLVVDGWSNGFGDMSSTINCASTACASATPTAAAGCDCKAINKAYELAHAATPVQTHVVVNVPATWSVRYHDSAYAFLVNLALAGSPNRDGTPSFGTSEDEVYKAISDKITLAAYHFTYTTSVPVAGSTTQDPDTLILTNSTYLYDTSVSYPTWKGTLRAFDTASSVELKWDAASVAASGHPADWTHRRVFLSDKSGNVVQVQITAGGAISNASTIHSAGLGATSAEAESIMQWLLGKPSMGNPAPLMGSITSSTPIAVGQGAANGLNGSTQFSAATWKRPQLVYVGGDDGMLHAFFGHAGSKTLAGTTYEGGEEAFAFIPNDMLPVIAKQYSQGSQKLAVDKSEHIFGLAGSPKVKDMCIGAGCESSLGADWHTILVMPEGPGGNKPFALDITNVIHEVNGLQPNLMSLRWSAAPAALGSNNAVKMSPVTDGDKWAKSLGETTSVPAFYFAGYAAGSADNRVVFASGYPTMTGTGYDNNQGLVIVNADASTGAVKSTKSIYGLGTSCTAPPKRAIMADVALARNYSSVSTSQYLMGAYVVDTWGNTYQYVPHAADSTKVLTTLYALGCTQPLYFAPAVVQLDRAPKVDTSSKGNIYLAQVTNSNMDPDTMRDATMYSQIVVTKLDGNVSPPTIVANYNLIDDPYNHGQIVLTTDPDAPAATQICLQTVNGSSFDSFTDGTKNRTDTCTAAGGTLLPSTARPVSTPTAVLRSDGLGFQIITTWYDVPADMSEGNDCSSGTFNYGKSYITVHEFGADGTWYQIAGITISDAVLTGVTFVGTGLFVDGINASSTPQSLNIGESFSTTQQILNNSARERYSRTSWAERVDL